MRRRHFLAAVGSTSLALLGGCSQSDTNGGGETTSQTQTTATPTPSPFIKRGKEFRSFLADKEITVVEITAFPAERRVDLRYISTKDSYQAVGGEVGSIAGGFFRHIGDGWSAKRLDATVLEDQDTKFGTWYAKAEWFEQFQNGDLSANELSLKVLNTLEASDE
ncbi:hypothetical protein ACH9L7_15885 [Haloferax sp. S1W]|uniref:hypothetical protein n=1 Tax=Haloferax sp. S1W TaxID=3377110 RepID=UPI0037C6A86C